MKTLFHSFYIIAILAVVSCRSTRQETFQQSFSTITVDTIVKERIVHVLTPEDSAKIIALLRCDSVGRVVLDWYEQECSKNSQLQFRLDSLGNVMAKFKVRPDTVFITVADTSVNRREEQNEQQTVTVEVERQWTRWESYLHICGLIFNGIVLILIACLLIRIKLKKL